MIRFLCALALLASPVLASGPGGWKSLFDRKTLNGWRAEGNASWSVRDGAIVGRQGPGHTPGDLYTQEEWADFELECDFRVHWPANSGIWFRRSAAQPGYQADILEEAAYPDAFSGSLYAMGKGFLVKNTDPASVHKNGWNRLRIRAAGDQIVIGLNGKTVVSTRDSRFLKTGSIGIQVHPGKQFEVMEIEVKNIRLRPVAEAVQ